MEAFNRLSCPRLAGTACNPYLAKPKGGEYPADQIRISQADNPSKYVDVLQPVHGHWLL